MRAFSQGMVTLLGAATIMAGSASVARANCVELSPAKRVLSAARPGLLAPATPHAFDDTQLGRVQDQGDDIIGMWHIALISKGNSSFSPFQDGDVLDDGYSQWHSDGTEILNSSRDPATSNFCLGVWRYVGHGTYHLNHYALSWDNTGHFCTAVPPASSCFVGLANIREEVTLDSHGNQMTGMVTITQYDTEGHQIIRLGGTVRGQRITVD